MVSMIVWYGMVRFVMVVAKHAWIVWRDSVIESSSHETWNEQFKEPLRLFLGDNDASFIFSCFKFNL